MQSIQPDIILSFTPKVILLVGLLQEKLGFRHVPTFSGLGYQFTNGNKPNWFISLLYRRALRKADRVILHNEDDQSLLIELNFIHTNQSEVVPGSGIDVQYFKPRLKSEQSPPFTFIFIGKLLKNKGAREFIEAAEQFHQEDTRFVLAGKWSASMHDAISAACYQRMVTNPRIEHKSEVDDIRDEIAECDVVVLPSYREGLPKSLLEAMSMEKPIITTNVPGCRNLVEDGVNGLLVTSGNVASLVRAMNEMADFGESRLKMMGIRSREIVLEKYAFHLICEQYLKTLEKARQ